MPTTISTHKYLDVYNAIRSDILLRVYPDNSLLPTESHLIKQYGVSRNTVRRAVKMLQDEGFVSTRQGSGSLVNTHGEKLMDPSRPNIPPWSTATSAIEYHITPSTIQVSKAAVDKIPAPEEVAKAFHIAPGTQIYRVQRVWKMDGIPYNYMIQYINRDILPGFSKHVDEDRKVHKLLEKYWGYHRQRSEEHISCINAGFIEAGLLNVEVGTALLHTSRQAYCEKGVFEYAFFYGNPKYTGYVMHMPD